MLLPLSSSKCAPIRAVSPNKDTDVPNLSETDASDAYNFVFSVQIFEIPSEEDKDCANTYTVPASVIPLLSLPLAPIKTVSPYRDTEDPNMLLASGSEA